jgi:hypothetical protein
MALRGESLLGTPLERYLHNRMGWSRASLGSLARRRGGREGGREGGRAQRQDAVGNNGGHVEHIL